MRKPFFLLFLLFAASTVSAIPAQLLFENVSDANYDVKSSLDIQNNWLGKFTAQAASQFTATGSGLLDFVELSLSNNEDPGASVNVGLYTDDAGTIGTLLEEVTASGFPFKGDNIPLFSVDFSDTTSISAGATYWLVLSSDSDNARLGWEQVDSGNIATREGNPIDQQAWIYYSTRSRGGMRLHGTAGAAVPDSSTHGILGFSLLALALARRLTKCSWQAGREEW